MIIKKILTSWQSLSFLEISISMSVLSTEEQSEKRDVFAVFSRCFRGVFARFLTKTLFFSKKRRRTSGKSPWRRPCTLFSINRIMKKKAQVVCINDECRIYTKNEKQILHVVKHRDQYELQLIKFKTIIIAMTSQYTHKYNEKTLKIWHRRIEHLRMNDLKRLSNMTNDINLINVVRYNDVCFSCMKEK